MQIKRKSWALSDERREVMATEPNRSYIPKETVTVASTIQSSERFGRYIKALGKGDFSGVNNRDYTLYNAACDRCDDVDEFISEIESQIDKNAYLALLKTECKSETQQADNTSSIYSDEKIKSRQQLLEEYSKALNLTHIGRMNALEIATFEIACRNCDDVMDFVNEVRGQAVKIPYRALLKTERKGVAPKWA